jgi:hypothetical protein
MFENDERHEDPEIRACQKEGRWFSFVYVLAERKGKTQHSNQQSMDVIEMD